MDPSQPRSPRSTTLSTAISISDPDVALAAELARSSNRATDRERRQLEFETGDEDRRDVTGIVGGSDNTRNENRQRENRGSEPSTATATTSAAPNPNQPPEDSLTRLQDSFLPLSASPNFDLIPPPNPLVPNSNINSSDSNRLTSANADHSLQPFLAGSSSSGPNPTPAPGHTVIPTRLPMPELAVFETQTQTSGPENQEPSTNNRRNYLFRTPSPGLWIEATRNLEQERGGEGGGGDEQEQHSQNLWPGMWVPPSFDALPQSPVLGPRRGLTGFEPPFRSSAFTSIQNSLGPGGSEGTGDVIRAGVEIANTHQHENENGSRDNSNNEAPADPFVLYEGARNGGRLHLEPPPQPNPYRPLQSPSWTGSEDASSTTAHNGSRVNDRREAPSRNGIVVEVDPPVFQPSPPHPPPDFLLSSTNNNRPPLQHTTSTDTNVDAASNRATASFSRSYTPSWNYVAQDSADANVNRGVLPTPPFHPSHSLSVEVGAANNINPSHEGNWNQDVDGAERRIRERFLRARVRMRDEIEAARRGSLTQNLNPDVQGRITGNRDNNDIPVLPNARPVRSSTPFDFFDNLYPSQRDNLPHQNLVQAPPNQNQNQRRGQGSNEDDPPHGEIPQLPYTWSELDADSPPPRRQIPAFFPPPLPAPPPTGPLPPHPDDPPRAREIHVALMLEQAPLSDERTRVPNGNSASSQGPESRPVSLLPSNTREHYFRSLELTRAILGNNHWREGTLNTLAESLRASHEVPGAPTTSTPPHTETVGEQQQQGEGSRSSSFWASNAHGRTSQRDVVNNPDGRNRPHPSSRRSERSTEERRREGAAFYERNRNALLERRNEERNGPVRFSVPVGNSPREIRLHHIAERFHTFAHDIQAYALQSGTRPQLRNPAVPWNPNRFPSSHSERFEADYFIDQLADLHYIMDDYWTNYGPSLYLGDDDQFGHHPHGYDGPPPAGSQWFESGRGQNVQAAAGPSRLRERELEDGLTTRGYYATRHARSDDEARRQQGQGSRHTDGNRNLQDIDDAQNEGDPSRNSTGSRYRYVWTEETRASPSAGAPPSRSRALGSPRMDIDLENGENANRNRNRDREREQERDQDGDEDDDGGGERVRPLSEILEDMPRNAREYQRVLTTMPNHLRSTLLDSETRRRLAAAQTPEPEGDEGEGVGDGDGNQQRAPQSPDARSEATIRVRSPNPGRMGTDGGQPPDTVMQPVPLQRLELSPNLERARRMIPRPDGSSRRLVPTSEETERPRIRDGVLPQLRRRSLSPNSVPLPSWENIERVQIPLPSQEETERARSRGEIAMRRARQRLEWERAGRRSVQPRENDALEGRDLDLRDAIDRMDAAMDEPDDQHSVPIVPPLSPRFGFPESPIHRPPNAPDGLNVEANGGNGNRNSSTSRLVQVLRDFARRNQGRYSAIHEGAGINSRRNTIPEATEDLRPQSLRSLPPLNANTNSAQSQHQSQSQFQSESDRLNGIDVSPRSWHREVVEDEMENEYCPSLEVMERSLGRERERDRLMRLDVEGRRRREDWEKWRERPGEGKKAEGVDRDEEGEMVGR